MGRVSGKVAIVTGAARGMGAAHARRLVEEGARVVLTDLLDQEGEAMARSLGANARFMHHDVSKEADWKRIVGDTEAAFGPISVLVNNAAISGFSPIETLEEAEYRRIIEVNQFSVFLGMKTVVPSMKRAGGGAIINISSSAGLVGLPYLLAYVASKFAVRGMTKSAAIELAPDNIRVNVIHPGTIRTPLMAEAPRDVEQRLIDAAPAHRLGEPEEVANVMLLLASDESRFLTGAEIPVDGGLTCQ
jgi:3alpha(or 20beta)-hydroxysteroid dehydrogenase